MHVKRALSVVLAAPPTLATAVILPAAPAQTATNDVGYCDASYRDANNVQVPTDDKPQSKLGFQDSTWWGVLYSTQAHATTIQRLSWRLKRLSLATQQWSDTATAVFECSLDAAAYAECSSPFSYTNLTGGAHTFKVRAKDSMGNVDATPASRSWTVDPVSGASTVLPFASFVDNIDAI
jgi:hypothetical protein